METTTPNQTWFYNLEDVVFSSGSSYDTDGYVNYTEFYINGVLQGTSSYTSTFSRCFALNGSPSNDCYQLASGQSTVTVGFKVRDNHGNWSSLVTKTYTIQEHKGRKYFVKDHLGSVRATVNKDGNVLGYDDYYPFDLAPVADFDPDPNRTWFYNLEDVVFSSTSYVPNGYVSWTEWHINGTYQTGGSGATSFSKCFALPGSPPGDCYQLSSGQTTVQVKVRVQSNHGYWDDKTITYTIQEHKGRKYFVKDHLGSVRATVNRDGNMLGYDYYPFGLTMPGRSSNSANPNDNYKFTGHERDDEAGINLIYAGARYMDPVIGGRFLSIDPLAREFPNISPYAYGNNNPLRYTDPTGMAPECPQKPCDEQRAAQGVAIREGYAAAKASSVRDTYVQEASKATTSAERTSVKNKARAATPTEYATVAEAMRPIGEEGSRTGGTVNKTNANVNSKIKIAGRIGRGTVVLSAGVSVYNITTAQDKTRAVTGEAGAWGGALIGGGLGAKGGATVGAFFGGVGAVPGAFIGGIIGGAAGAIVGEEAANKAYDYLFGE